MSAADVAALPARSIGAIPGAASQIMWRHGGSMAGVQRIEAVHREARVALVTVGAPFDTAAAIDHRIEVDAVRAAWNG